MKLVFITLAAWVAIVLVAEALWRRRLLRGEYARKFLHILLGVSIAFMPYYLPWSIIKGIGLVGLLVVVLMRMTGIFGSIYDIKRRSWGEIIGPISMLILSLFEPSNILFMAAVLHLALADGLAAVIGTRFGRDNSYRILGYKKSVAGSTAFFLTSFLIMLGIMLFAQQGYQVSVAALILIPLITTTTENISPFGIDNALILVVVVGLFRVFGIG